MANSERPRAKRATDADTPIRTCRWCFHESARDRLRTRTTLTNHPRPRDNTNRHVHACSSRRGGRFPHNPKTMHRRPKERAAHDGAAKQASTRESSPCSDAEAHRKPHGHKEKRRTRLAAKRANTPNTIRSEAPPLNPKLRPHLRRGHARVKRPGWPRHKHATRVCAHKRNGCPKGNRSNRPQKRCPTRLPHTGRRWELSVSGEGKPPHDQRTSRSV
jgi:hypothetical protein|mmetsp:Transcript_77888/g.154726  ORF Transcript_77888/g.154726 Transcript_77888/m.154726 type:complete len:217 (-) Transcript_77888:147-797(-)